MGNFGDNVIEWGFEIGSSGFGDGIGKFRKSVFKINFGSSVC